MKCDRTGDVEWEQYYPLQGSNWCNDITKTEDDGYALVGWTGSRVQFIKTDSEGEYEWSRMYGADSMSVYGIEVIQTSDGGYAIAGGGGDNENGQFGYAVRLDEEGEQMWDSIYGRFFLGSIIEIDNGDLVLGGVTIGHRHVHRDDIYILRVDENGDILWEGEYGTRSGSESCSGLFLMPDGGYMVAGNTDNFPLHLRDNFLLFRTGPDPLYNSIRLTDPVLPSSFVMQPAYPNPFNATTKLSYGLPAPSNVSVMVCDVKGHLISKLVNEHQTAGQHTIVWNAQSLPTGVYLVKMEAGAFRAVRKVVLVK